MSAVPGCCDKARLPNLKNAWPVVTQRLATYDPDNNYGANYMWGTTGIGYNVKTAQKILGPDARIDSWDMVFKPEVIARFKDCGVHVLDAPDDAFATALNYLGLNPNSTREADLQRAADLVMKIRPLVRKQCDVLISIPQYGGVGSLNASVAGGIALPPLRKSCVSPVLRVTPQPWRFASRGSRQAGCWL
jgi:spermidine/putrescine-binding protein